LNSSPFSLDTVFLPEDAGEDKVDLELGGWEVHGLGANAENAHAFKQHASSPPAGARIWHGRAKTGQRCVVGFSLALR